MQTLSLGTLNHVTIWGSLLFTIATLPRARESDSQRRFRVTIYARFFQPGSACRTALAFLFVYVAALQVMTFDYIQTCDTVSLSSYVTRCL